MQQYSLENNFEDNSLPRKTGQVNLSYIASSSENESEGTRSSTTLYTAVRSRNASLEKTPRKYEPSETRRMNRNIIIISFGFLLHFTAYNSMTNLQSSLHQQGLGTYSMATVYIALVVSCMFLPTWLMSKLTVKWCLVLSIFGYTLYMGAQFYPSYATMIPTAAILGFSAAPLWISKCTYLTLVANEYASLKGVPAPEIIVKYFGIFFCAFQSSQIWGNLISSLIFSSGETKSPYNSTVFLEGKCGANFCPSIENSEDKDEESDDNINAKINLFSGVCLACTFAAIALVAFIDPLSRYGEKDEGVQEKQINKGNLLVATFRHMKNPFQILLIPLTIFSGLEQGFITADFSQAYITCAYGVHNVGYVLITSGICDAVMSLGFGWLVKYTGRVPIFILGAVINISVIMVFLFWKPNPEEAYVFFIIAGFWGTADAIWQTQINAMYGAVFPQNEMSAFSNYRLWESMGFIFAYINASLLCVRLKIIIILGFLLLGMLGYLIVEFCIFTKNRKKPLNKN